MLSAPHLWSARPTLTPQDILGSKLVGFVDAENNSKITAASGACSAYADIISASSFAQGTAAARPAITTNALTGRQVLRFDGTDDFLDFTGIPTGWPTGANAGEIIAIVTQSALPADTSSRVIVQWGGTTSATSRSLRRGVSGGMNCVQSVVGTGAGSPVFNHTPDFSGNHLARLIVDGTSTYVDQDGAVSAATACVPGTGTTRVRIGGTTAGTPIGFLQGDLSALLITNALLTTAEFNALAVWAGPRVWG